MTPDENIYYNVCSLFSSRSFQRFRYFPRTALPSPRHGVYPVHRHPSAAVDLQKVPGALPLPHHLPRHQPLVDQEGRPGEWHWRCEG